MNRAAQRAGQARVCAGLTLLAFALGCRHFDVCGTSLACAALATPDGGAAAGEPGDASPLRLAAECTGPLLDCDSSSLNGCETDVSRDPSHCGACGAACDGLCDQARCVPFRVIEPPRVVPASPLSIGGEYVFSLAAPQAGGPLTLRRVRRSDGEVLTLAQGAWQSAGGVAAGPARVYVGADDSLFSVPLEGGELKLETTPVEQLVMAGAHVALLADGQLSLRLGDSGSFSPWRGLEAVQQIRGGQRLLLIASAAVLATLDPATNELARFPLGDVQVRALGSFDDNRQGALAYFVGSAADGPDTLYRASADAAPEALLELADITGWSVGPVYLRPFYGAPCLIASFERGRAHGLRLMSLRDPSQRFEWPTRGQIEALAVGELSTGAMPNGEAWFFERFDHALVSLSLEDLLRNR